MTKVTFIADECKGCGLCVQACPQKIVTLGEHKINAKGFRPAGLTNADDCIGCAFCAIMCPDVVITIEK
ncbi:MAG: 4Fe-4S binding protein [Dehalococcoidia bacterium]|nr:4Fe-4S binding protein [Dehalococcoidia bacterium]